MLSDCNAADLQMPPRVHWAAVREPVLPQSSSSSSHDIAAGAAPTLLPDFPTIDEICSGLLWTTVDHNQVMGSLRCVKTSAAYGLESRQQRTA